MTLRNLLGPAEYCWAHLDGQRCEKDPGHGGQHYAEGKHWTDHGLGPAIDVDGLDSWPDGAA